MPPDRDRQLRGFLAANGWEDARRIPLADDASFRRYERIISDGRRAVLMDAPPDKEDVRPFVHIARHLRTLGYSAPQIYAEDDDLGALLLEDLGDDTFTRMLANGGDERMLYEAAVDLLTDLHRHHIAVAVPNGLAPYDAKELLREAMLLPEWYLRAMRGRAAETAIVKQYAEAWRSLVPVTEAVAQTLVLRDFHVDNLIWLPDRNRVARCGVLDFQDALVGPAPYDLMSLLEDARRDIAPSLVADMKRRYFAALPHFAGREFDAAYAVLAAQRHCKVIGIFTRLAQRDGKYDYLIHIPRVWRLLEAACRHPVLAPVSAWLDQHIPAPSRGIPRITGSA